MSKIDEIKNEVKKVVVGHDNLIDSMLIALLTHSHLLVEGVPGLAKTTAINALSKVLGLDFKRVQFTPDLLPSDITGVEIYDPKSSEFKIKKGPVFTNLLLADEINRAPAKVQSALLEVMQERQVTIGEETFKLEPPFFVMATQNPVEQEGTYPLPEAQLDRFMLKVLVSYNTPKEEFEIVKRVENFEDIKLNKVVTKEELFNLQKEVKNVHMDDALLEYIIKLITATRNPSEFGLDELKEYIEFGASPRASINLYKASKALAFIRGKDFVTPLDIAKIAPDILRHRIILNYKAIANNIDSDYIIQKILQKIPTP
ncbi:MAG: MoxR family ATPase [Epsilonproteobacteria bacterium]|nr:MoxR family ATPase [Campylobacterota bacterium]